MISHLRASRAFSTYYPLIISPNYDLGEYSPAYLQEIKRLTIDHPNLHQIDPHRLPAFLAQQIRDDQKQFLKGKEIVFIGRSNVGKSSLINEIFGSKKVAKAAKRTGTTKFLHFHQGKLGGEEFVAIDTPGYGFANMNKKRRELWYGLLNEYLKISSRLCQIFHVINFEHGLKKNDEVALTRASQYNVNIQLVLNKIDKVGEKRFMGQIKAINEAVRRLELPNINNRIIACSTKTKFGMEVLKCRVAECLRWSKQRNIDRGESLLLEYLKENRVGGVSLGLEERSQSKPHIVRKLIYNSKLTKFLV